MKNANVSVSAVIAFSALTVFADAIAHGAVYHYGWIDNRI